MAKIWFYLSKVDWWRWISIIVFGITASLVIDLVLTLIYRNYEFSTSLTDLAEAVLYAFVVVEGIRFINRKLDDRLPWGKHIAGRLAIQFFLDIGYVLLLMVGMYFFAPKAQLVILQEKLVVYFIIVLLTFFFLLVDMWAFFLDRWRVSLAEVERFRKENTEAQLATLKSQVNPHFLFNSLNTLSSLIFQDQEQAAKFVRQLSRVYRYVLENRERELLPLSEELDFLDSYVFLLTLRFQESLTFDIRIDEKHMKKLVAPMILQMLIENAIKHNIVSRKRPLKVSIYTDGNGQIVVQNNLQLKTMKEYSSQLGLKNIRSRYNIISNRQVTVLEYQDSFIVKIPLLDRA